ncbi:helix-turn-helix domain-containing protein [Streptomyces sp. DSM 44917]|uniref:Helix-turn-helix domain-containing protein n=1 Tax=Streptomyces boetiae TaxID=3075541 RepID=A0ABU2L4H0_9ACTN|nr:helix-turn-helix domain-containing protein [Streptomyces sp. DSM 44917]MDT0306452.1 helix-turn-helix domain-containing protein [Streptomyces sp. DSM 44917]
MPHRTGDGTDEPAPSAPPAPHRVAVVAVPPLTTFDLSIPGLVLGELRVDGHPAYDVRVCTARPGTVRGLGGLDVVLPHGLDEVAEADTVLVTGIWRPESTDRRVLNALREAAAAGRRIASICSGSFVLAEAGLLDGRAATTYWEYSDVFRRRYPDVDLVGDVLFVDDGQVLTSAGGSAGVDLCLHLIRNDLGAAVAAEAARRLIAAPVRPGGQAQVVQAPLPEERGLSLAATREWALGRLDRPLALPDLARHARTSVRTLTRRFRAETGLSPLQWLLEARLDRAQELLERTDLTMEHVAHRSGIGTADSLRRHLARRTGLTPRAWRAAHARVPATP